MVPVVRIANEVRRSEEMSKATLTFELGGRVELKELEEGIRLFTRLVSNLTPRSGVTWVVDDLQPGSALVTLRGESDDPAKVEQIIAEYEVIGCALSRHENLHHTKTRVVQAAHAIADFAGPREYVRLETPNQDYIVYGNRVADGNAHTEPSVSIGAITGRVQTLTSRSGLRFNLYDTVHDRAVACYLGPGQEEIMREAWGNRATVVGRVSRDPLTGKPMSIRDIRQVELLDDVAPGVYRQAKGAVPWEQGDMLPEEAIRLLRDA